MPSVPIAGPYRWFYYSGDRDEPPHIHMEREGLTAKFWLSPVRLEQSGGFSRHEIRQIQRLVEEHRQTLLRSWNAFFSD